MLDWIREHWVATIFMTFAACAMVSHFVLRLTWPKQVLVGISISLVAITYWTFFAITALGVRLFGRRLLPQPRKDASTYWMDREETEPSIDSLKRQG